MSLEAFFKPRSVALVGASTNPTKLGHAVLKNLVDCGYAHYGEIYPVNPNAKEILGYLAYPSRLLIALAAGRKKL